MERENKIPSMFDGHLLFRLRPMLLAGAIWLSQALCYVLIL